MAWLLIWSYIVAQIWIWFVVNICLIIICMKTQISQLIFFVCEDLKRIYFTSSQYAKIYLTVPIYVNGTKSEEMYCYQYPHNNLKRWSVSHQVIPIYLFGDAFVDIWSCFLPYIKCHRLRINVSEHAIYFPLWLIIISIT